MSKSTRRPTSGSATPPPNRTASDLEFGDAFITTIASSPMTASAYRYGLGRLAQFITDTKYMQPAMPPAPQFPAGGLRDDVLLRFHEWMVDHSYAQPTRDNYIAAVKRFLIWLDANDRLPAGFQVGKAVNRLAAARGTRRAAKAGREPDPGLPRIVTYYDSNPPARFGLAARPAGTTEDLRARAIVHTLYASAGPRERGRFANARERVRRPQSEVRITGKGGKDRLLLLTKDAQRAIAAYCRERGDDYPGPVHFAWTRRRQAAGTRHVVGGGQEGGQGAELIQGHLAARLPAFPRAAVAARRHGPRRAASLSGPRRHQHHAPRSTRRTRRWRKCGINWRRLGESAREAAEDEG